MYKFIILINRNKLRIYEITNQNKIELFRIRGHKYYELNSNNLAKSIEDVSEFMLESLNYNNFSSCSFNVIYNGVETELIGILIEKFVSCNTWEMQKLESILPLLTLRAKLVPVGEMKVIGFEDSNWLVEVKEDGVIETKNTEVNCEIEFDIDDILENIVNDYSFVVKQSEEELDFDFDRYARDYDYEVEYNGEKIKGLYTGYVKEGLPNGSGIFIGRENNYEYEGEWSDGLFHGEGILIDTDGDRYKGEFRKGKERGIGIVVYSDGHKIAGEWSGEELNGIGITITSEGNKVVGEYKGNKQNGLELKIDSSDNKTIGEYEDGELSGLVMSTDNEKGKICAEIIDNRVNGLKMIIFPNGDKEFAEYKDDEADGLMMYIKKKGEKGCGEIENNKMNGLGMRISPNEYKELGEFKNDKLHGKGCVSFLKGGEYVAEFKSGKIYGKGIIEYEDGGKYVGEFMREQLHGKGMLCFTDGTKYIGDLKYDKFDGQGVSYDENGKVINKGKWEKGELKNDCFITTATFNSLGKGDNCSELNKFRWFRDNWLANQPEGKRIVEEYYNIAPLIVSRIDEKVDNNRIYNFLWNNYLQKCFSLIQDEYYEKAKELYMDMVKRLKKDFLE